MGIGPALMPCSRKAPDSHPSPAPPILRMNAALRNTVEILSRMGNCCTRETLQQAQAHIRVLQAKWRAKKQEGGVADSRRQPLWDEAVVRIYFGGNSFKSVSTTSRCLTNSTRRCLQFRGGHRDSEWRPAFSYVISVRSKCLAAKWANQMPGARPYRPMQQIHGLRPFFQDNPCCAFRASAANIGVHHRPPTISGNNRSGWRALIAPTNLGE